MMPVQHFFEGKITLIRPLCEVYEKDIEKLARRLQFPVYNTECPYKHTNIRTDIKPVLRHLQKMNKKVKEHIYQAHFSIDREYGDFSSITRE
jgi:tRNA 2-thiocytidine biosynthesis protein TtcA